MSVKIADFKKKENSVILTDISVDFTGSSVEFTNNLWIQQMTSVDSTVFFLRVVTHDQMLCYIFCECVMSSASHYDSIKLYNRKTTKQASKLKNTRKFDCVTGCNFLPSKIIIDRFNYIILAWFLQINLMIFNPDPDPDSWMPTQFLNVTLKSVRCLSYWF